MKLFIPYNKFPVLYNIYKYLLKCRKLSFQYVMFSFNSLLLPNSCSFTIAPSRICRARSLESLTTLPISSHDFAVSPFNAKYSLTTCSSRSVNDSNNLDTSNFIIFLATIASGLNPSGPRKISCNRKLG